MLWKLSRQYRIDLINENHLVKPDLVTAFGSAPASNSREKMAQSALAAAIMSGVKTLDLILTRRFMSSLPASKWFKMTSMCWRFVFRTADANGVSPFSARTVKLDPCLIWGRRHVESFLAIFKWQLPNAKDHRYFYIDVIMSQPRGLRTTRYSSFIYFNKVIRKIILTEA